MALRLLLAALAALIALGCGDAGRGPGDLGLDGGGADDDVDGDGISNLVEGFEDEVDTDEDGTPDFLDADSDGDGIDDRFETSRDSDGDGVPDFRDLDADNNGIPDEDELFRDTDGNGIRDYQDPDDDGDGIFDVEELERGIDTDTDGDGLPDWQDEDSDNDFIVDGDERGADTDRDGLLDLEDLDSDNDGLSDEVESGDLDLSTSPVDTDGDLVPDFRDLDSDDDGLSDTLEAASGTSPTDADTDDDGVSDLIEVGARTDALDASDNPRENGDFVFVVPFEDDPDPAMDTLEFETALREVDLYFVFDTTGSMGAELDVMRNPATGVPAIVDSLRCQPFDDPRTTGCIESLWTGIGRFDELDTYTNLLVIQDDPTLTSMSVPNTGGGAAEAPLQVPVCVAAPELCNLSSPNCSELRGAIGCPGYRRDAVRILLQVSDANDQCRDDEGGARCDMFDANAAGSVLRDTGIKYIALFSDTDGRFGHRELYESLGTASGSVDNEGNPFALEALDAAVAEQAVNAVRALAETDFRVTISGRELPEDDGDALRFIEDIRVNNSGEGSCTAVPDEELEDADGDGDFDAFAALLPRTPVCWDVIPVRNDFEPAAREPKLFRARLSVFADNSRVDEREVFFLVPPTIGSIPE